MVGIDISSFLLVKHFYFSQINICQAGEKQAEELMLSLYGQAVGSRERTPALQACSKNTLHVQICKQDVQGHVPFVTRHEP